jgi:hypothetical protein
MAELTRPRRKSQFRFGRTKPSEEEVLERERRAFDPAGMSQVLMPKVLIAAVARCAPPKLVISNIRFKRIDDRCEVRVKKIT